ncbi:MAG: hypothetical protein FJ135_12810 [Deltaproteobacteria bacterium]|nr:hypothetical protein [Deltaproteobacteria bacterium]
MPQDQVQPEVTELSERLCQIVNEIFATFNQKNVTPPEAGTIILALIHRLMGVLADNPDSRRDFVASIIEVVNRHLLESLEGDSSPPCQT